MKRFKLKTLEIHSKELEETLGYTAEGIQFSNGVCVLCWLSSVHSTVAIYESIEIIEFIHGHQGKTIVEWVDTELKGLDIELTGCNHDLYFSQRKQSYLCIKCNKIFKSVEDKQDDEGYYDIWRERIKIL